MNEMANYAPLIAAAIAAMAIAATTVVLWAWIQKNRAELQEELANTYVTKFEAMVKRQPAMVALEKTDEESAETETDSGDGT